VLYHFSYSTSPFLGWVFFEIGSCELFAQAGFLISTSQVGRITGMSHMYLTNITFILKIKITNLGLRILKMTGEIY
jgi:hypothetical protein